MTGDYVTKSELEEIRELREKFEELHSEVREMQRAHPEIDRRKMSRILSRFSDADWDRHERILKKVEYIEAGGVFLKHTTGIAVAVGGAWLMVREIFNS